MNLNQYLSDLDANTYSVLEVIRKYSDTELTFKKEGECSIADLLEHICISDQRTSVLLNSNAGATSAVSELFGDEKLKKIVVDYKGGPKITETELKEIKGLIGGVSDFEKMFVEQRNELKEDLKSGKIEISNKTYKHIYLNDMTVSDWLKYLIYHTMRHLNDIQESSLLFKKIL